MIIPVKCFTCGMLIANKYRYYLKRIAAETSTPTKESSITYLSAPTTSGDEVSAKTIEGFLLDELGITKMCCRRHFLTHVDIG